MHRASRLARHEVIVRARGNSGVEGEFGRRVSAEGERGWRSTRRNSGDGDGRPTAVSTQSRGEGGWRAGARGGRGGGGGRDMRLLERSVTIGSSIGREPERVVRDCLLSHASSPLATDLGRFFRTRPCHLPTPRRARVPATQCTRAVNNAGRPSMCDTLLERFG
jgi:hypothetical protein